MQLPNGGAVSPGAWTDLPKEEVLAALSRLLDSSHLKSSRKCSRFFRYVVEAALDGRFDCLKERTLGVEVFEREPHYDTNQDPIVRGTAGEIRKRLAQYYLEAGRDDAIRFSLPSGSYVPEVHRVVSRASSAPAEPEKVLAPAVPIVPAPVAAVRRSPVKTFVIAGFLAAAIVVCALWLLPRKSALDHFWEPVMKSGIAPLVCLGQPQLYGFRSDTATKLNDWFGNEGAGDEPPADIKLIPLSTVIPLWSETVSLSDAEAFARLESMFANKRKQLDVNGERSVSLTDLRKRPCILIGAFDNGWTLNLTGELRFYFQENAQTRAQVIRDRMNPGNTRWQLVDPWPPSSKIEADYAVVTRVFNRTTEQPVVILAGISQYGTQAAAEFVTNPEYFARSLSKLPKGWEKKNLQVVLYTRVLSGVSGPPSVLAVNAW